MDRFRKDAEVSAAGVEASSDSDVQQVPGKNYDPASDVRDMRRLGKSQELKVCPPPPDATASGTDGYSSADSASSPSWAMLLCSALPGSFPWSWGPFQSRMAGLLEQSGSPSQCVSEWAWSC